MHALSVQKQSNSGPQDLRRPHSGLGTKSQEEASDWTKRPKITDLCIMANSPLTWNPACQKRLLQLRRRARLQKIRAVHSTRAGSSVVDPRQNLHTSHGRKTDLCQYLPAVKAKPLCSLFFHAPRPAGKSLVEHRKAQAENAKQFVLPKTLAATLRSLATVACHLHIAPHCTNVPEEKTFADRPRATAYAEKKRVFFRSADYRGENHHFFHAAACGISGTFRKGPALLTS
jgi:hypothetical protein